jgi:hypothetical protein
VCVGQHLIRLDEEAGPTRRSRSDRGDRRKDTADDVLERLGCGRLCSVGGGVVSVGVSASAGAASATAQRDTATAVVAAVAGTRCALTEAGTRRRFRRRRSPASTENTIEFESCRGGCGRWCCADRRVNRRFQHAETRICTRRHVSARDGRRMDTSRRCWLSGLLHLSLWEDRARNDLPPSTSYRVVRREPSGKRGAHGSHAGWCFRVERELTPDDRPQRFVAPADRPRRCWISTSAAKMHVRPRLRTDAQRFHVLGCRGRSARPGVRRHRDSGAANTQGQAPLTKSTSVPAHGVMLIDSVTIWSHASFGCRQPALSVSAPVSGAIHRPKRQLRLVPQHRPTIRGPTIATSGRASRCATNRSMPPGGTLVSGFSSQHQLG